MKTHLALLRGINVGGNKKLPMADLRAFVEAIGFKDARTLLQSGNLVFRSDGERDDQALEAYLETEAAKHLGLSTTFILRTADEWGQIIVRNPFPEAAASDPGHLLVMCFREPPATAALELLRAKAVGSERFHPEGREIYAVFPHGAGTSKMANLLLSPRVSRHASSRNWNTVIKMRSLVDA